MIYMDYNSTTPIKQCALDAMMPYLTDRFYNPSSSYTYGQEVAQDIEDAREFFAKSINAKSKDEIYFVSCGSEADNWALRCLKCPTKLHVITDNIEHHAILRAMPTDNTFGVQVPVTKDGIVNIEKLVEALENARAPFSNRTLPKNVLISTMWINNELGTIQPIELIGNISNKYNAYFHTDAVQAYGKIPIDVQTMHIDMLSTSSHKVGAPRGSGFLYVRKGTPLKPLIYGGQQENHMRAGTENVAGIMAFKAAAEDAMAHMEENTAKLRSLHDYFVALLDKISGLSIINRHMNTFPNTISVDFGVPAEAMMAYFDQFNIAVSSGSACNSKDNTPSHVLTAIGLPSEVTNRVIRFSLSPDTTEDQLTYVAEIAKSGIEVLKQ